MGKRVFIVVERPGELRLILDLARLLQVRPLIGLRCRLAASSKGRWGNSGGDMSKFGLSSSDLIHAIRAVRSEGMLEGLQMLHFHIGSQVPEIRSIKDAMQEAATMWSGP
jgi:arginine decarboxylase